MDKKKISGFISSLWSLAGLALLVILFAILTGGKSVTWSNILTVIQQSIILMFAASGVFFVMTMGMMDLSVGGVICICCYMIAKVGSWNIPLGLIAMVATGLLIGFINGFSVAVLKVPSFLTTLCVSYIISGLMTQLIASQAETVPFSLYACDAFGFKLPLLIIIIGAAYFVFRHTKLGHDMRMVGTQETAAIFSGIDVNRTKIIGFVICGFLGSIAAFLTAVRSGTASVTTGSGMMFNAMIALILGGFPLNGGAKSKISAPIIGSLMLQVLSNGLVIVGVTTTLQQAIKGTLFLIIVIIMSEREMVAALRDRIHNRKEIAEAHVTE